jgi:molecular chaperone DnaJ
LRIRGKGVPVLNGHGKGDLVVRVVVQTPTRLTKRERELLQDLDSTTRVENKLERPSLLSKVKDIFG